MTPDTPPVPRPLAGADAPTPAHEPAHAPATPPAPPVERCDKGHPVVRGMPWHGAVCLTCKPHMGYRCEICRQPRYCCCC